jgi:hypothetical protein
MFELTLARAADRRQTPLLAICRGAQLLNVARGGTLHQHLPEVVGDTIQHRQPEPADQLTHAVTLEPDSRLAELLGWREGEVNSLHHQAVDEPGADLRVVARAADGTVEATLVALVQSVARLELEEGYVSGSIVGAQEVLAENRFIAARDGMAARLIDTTRETLRPVGDILEDLLRAAAPHAAELGCADALEEVRRLAADPGAERQRRDAAERDDLAGTVAALADQFLSL